MSRESDMLFGLLALQMGFVSKEHLLEATAVWMGDPEAKPLPRLLQDRGHLRDYHHAAVKAMVEAHLRDHAGDAALSLAAATVPRALKEDLLATIRRASGAGGDARATVGQASPPTPGAREALAQSVMRVRETDASSVIVVTRPAESKYEITGEIGHGGLGTVLNAVDNDIGREVALKVMREDVPGDFVERFLLEGRVTGRLEHPHIVPVHEVGVRVDKDGAKQVFFTMKKIEGRDLGHLLRDIARGAGETPVPRGAGVPARATHISLRRLVDHFHDVCLAVAFAHSKGVLHRDLKPSNIMIGAFGETLLVDWGLAKVKGEKDVHLEGDRRRLKEAGIEHPHTPQLTMEGEIVGTPAYMSPEQAEGRVAEVDERSDVWSLGAVLYEIMTLHPPFEGRTLKEMLSQVKSGRVTPPSERLKGSGGREGETVRPERGDAAGVAESKGNRAKPPFDSGSPDGGEPSLRADGAPSDPDRTHLRPPPAPSVPWTLPPELETICLKCLTRRKEDRYPSAEALAQEIELFLEGVKERERREKEAREQVEEGRSHLVRYRALADEIKAQEKRVKAISETIKPHQPVEEKRPLWGEEGRLKAMEEERIIAFTRANAHFGQALTCDAERRDALDGKCELFLDRFLDAEKRRDRKQMLLERRTLEQYDRDGRYAARLQAPGRLTIRTFAYECECLRPRGGRVPRTESGRSSEDPEADAQVRSSESESSMTECEAGTRPPVFRVEIAEECAIPWRDGRPRPDLPLEDKDRSVPRVVVRSPGSKVECQRPSSSPTLDSGPWTSGLPGHTGSCPRREVRGVEVWIARYEEREKRLQLGEERLVGVTPLAGVEVPNGSYRCTLRPTGGSRPQDFGSDGGASKAAGAGANPPASGDRPVPAPTAASVVVSSFLKPETFVPVLITRGETWEQEVNLYREEDVPDGFCLVPGGPYLAGEERAGGGPTETRITDDFFIAKYPVTCAEYLEFLNDLVARASSPASSGAGVPARAGAGEDACPTDSSGSTAESVVSSSVVVSSNPKPETRNPKPETLLAEARKRQPREGDQKFFDEVAGRFALPTDPARAALAAPDLPVMGISWFDAIAFVAWRSVRDGRLYRLLHEEEFEKAARGVDGRIYPWGDEYDGTFSNTTVSHPDRPRARAPGSFPVDESPYGVFDLGGNMRTWCWNTPEKPWRHYRCLRGGAWDYTEDLSRAANRQGSVPAYVDRSYGVRVCLPSRTS